MSNRQQNEAQPLGVSETTLQQKALYQPSGPANLLRMQYLLTTLLRARAALVGRRTAAGRGGERSPEPLTELRPFLQPSTWSRAAAAKRLNTLTGLQRGNERQAG